MSESTVPKSVLGLFAKWPSPGKVKTRLAQSTSPEWAARVADAFLRDNLARLVDLPCLRYLVYSPAEAEAQFAELTQDRYFLVPQTEGDLGHRIATFLEQRFREGADSVVLLGSDSPTVPLRHIEQAFTELQQVDVVLGPATDGGYYLLGCSKRVPQIFDAIAWGTSQVLRATLERLADPSWRVALLPPWYDVDTLDDWHFLRGHVVGQRKAGGDFRVPWTEAMFEEPPS